MRSRGTLAVGDRASIVDLVPELRGRQFDQPPSMTWIVPVVNADTSLAR
jgi:hypothetical protein